MASPYSVLSQKYMEVASNLVSFPQPYRYTDMESEDYHFYQGLVYLLENDVSTLGYDLTFSTEVTFPFC